MDTVVELVQSRENRAAPPTPEPESAGWDAFYDLPARWLVRALLPEEHGIETVTTGKPLAAAVAIMLAKNYSQLPVVDEAGNYAFAVS
ncbi:hypothetical protein [Amycolatopsis solani]|uniref:hypothetical protein n=1 Tax=Amycolatopsis solani TaxID=3028615 RepID=UPI0025B17298|nr:hypothetical protein [Amycolatopsis sp. MEP2-6]